MSSKGTSRLQPGSSTSVSPDSYHIDHVKLTTPVLGGAITITDIIKEVIIREGVTQPYVECDLFVVDAVGLINTLKLSGSETIDIKISRSPIKKSDEEKAKIELKLKVIEIFGYSRRNVSRQAFTIKCCSEHLYTNQTKILQRPFRNTIGRLVKDILEKDLRVDPDRIGTISNSSKGIIQGIYPSLRPYYAIKWLLRNAYEDSTPFYFWESVQNGIQFQSYKSLSEQEPFDTYDYRAFFEFARGTPEHYDEVRRRIRSLSSPLNMGQFNQIGNGAYGSTLYTFDIAEKKREKFIYSYKGMTKLNQNAPYSTLDEINNQTYDQLQNSKNYYISLNSKAFTESSNYHEPLKPTILKGEAHYHNMNFNTLNLQLYGDFNLTSGLVINLDISKVGSAKELDTPRMKDEYLSGKYFIHTIEHRFDDIYTQKITCKRDSLKIGLDSE